MIVTGSKIAIRQATPSDIPPIAKIMTSVSERPHSVEAVRAIMEESFTWLAVAGDDDAVGLTVLQPCTLEHHGVQTKAGCWRYLWVKPDQRKTGLYPRLVFTMMSEAAKLGIDLVYGAIRRPDVAAGHLALGFQKVGEIPVLLKPLNPATLFSKFHDLGSLAVGLSAVPDFAYRQYLSIRHLSAGTASTVTDVAATQCNLEDVIPVLRERFSENLQRSLTAETFLKRYSSNTDGDDYRTLAVHAGDEVRAAIVWRTATRGKDIRAAVIMEFGYRGEDQTALHCALVELEKRAIGFGCEVVLTLSSPRALQSLLRDAGYFTSNERYMLMKKGVPVPEHLDDWYFTFSDHDAF